MWFKYGLKAQKFSALGNGRNQHALNGQKLLAQGIALGIMAIGNSPCKGKSLIYIVRSNKTKTYRYENVNGNKT